jgi:hypothetical protein
MKHYFGVNDAVTTSDKSILKTELLRKIVYAQAEELMVGKQAINLEGMDALELKLTLPKVTRLDPEEVSEGALANYQSMEWYDVSKILRKEQVRVLITDEAKARMQSDIQMRYSIKAAARGLAWSKDTDIFTTLQAGAAHSTAASGAWTSSGTDIAADIAREIGGMLTDTVLTDQDIKEINIFYPVKLYGYLKKPIAIGEMHQSISRYIQEEYQINFIYTRQLDTKAMMVLKSAETGLHITYTGSAIPTAEEERIVGVGNQTVLTQYFKTFVMPEEENGTTNERIRLITGVCS